ncbi:MAG: miniconductance mechanosensitive channel, partial [Polaribacter sp.]
MDMKHLLYDYLVKTGMSDTSAKYLNMLVLLAGLLIISFMVHFIIRKIIKGLFTQFAAKTKTNFDNLLVKNKAPRNIAQIIPLIIALELSPLV